MDKMRTLFICAIFFVVSTAANLPQGFAPLPPLPVGSNTPATKKPTPTTKKVIITKPTPPPTTPLTTQRPTTTKPTTVTSKLPPSSAYIVPTSGATSSGNSGLNINVPAAQCNKGSSTNGAVQQALTSLQTQLSQTRQQHQAQNTVVQSMISQLQSKQTSYVNKISDLQNEVANLVKAFNTVCLRRQTSTSPSSFLPSVTPPTVSSGISNAAFQKAIQDVNNDISTAVRNFNTRIFNLSTIISTNEQQELKLHQNIESQIQQQARDIGRLSQQVIDLTTQLNLLNTSTIPSPTAAAGPTAADIAKLTAQVNKVASDIQLYDQNQQNQFTTLNLKAATLLSEVNNHTNAMRIISSNIFLAQTRIRELDKNVTIVHDALSQYRSYVNPEIARIDGDVSILQQNSTKLTNSLSRIDRSVLNVVFKLGADEQKLNAVDNDASQLKTDVSNLQGDLNTQGQEITAIKTGLIDLKNAIPVTELNNMNNIILKALSSGNQTLTQQQLQDLTNAITTITNKLSLINPPNASG